MALLKHLDKPIPEQAIEVPKTSKSSRRCRVPDFRSVPFVHQTAEQLVEVPTVVSFSSLRRRAEQIMDIPVSRRRRGGGEGGGGLQGLSPSSDSPAPEFEQILDIPVLCGCGSSGGGGLQGLHPGQSSTAFPEQLVDNPVSGGRPEQSSSSSLDGSNEDYTRFFALFPIQKKKCGVRPAGHCRSRRALQLMDAGGLCRRSSLRAEFSSASVWSWLSALEDMHELP